MTNDKGLGTVLTNASAIDRSATDFYPTPPEATHALIHWLEETGRIQEGSIVWEPACGEGHMAEAIATHGMEVVSSDKYIDTYSPKLLDFLTVGPDEAAQVDWIITNPPFKDSAAFIEKCLELGKPFAMLLKSQYWHSARRRALFERSKPTAVLPLTWRPDFHFGKKGGSPTMDVQWTVWDGSGSGALYVPLGKAGS